MSQLRVPRSTFGMFRRYIQTQSRTPPPPPQELVALLQTYEALPPHPISLAELTSFGENLSPDSVIASANFMISELPKRLAQRALATYPAPKNIEENWAFTRRLEDLVDVHSNDIPTLAKGFKECTKYISSANTSHFLDDIIRSRIAVRLMAEQHIAISHSLRSHDPKRDVGIINKKTSPRDMINMCARFVSELSEATLGNAPRLVLEGDVDATFPYVPVHLEYILTEVLKNSYRATVEHHSGVANLPPVVVTIAPSLLPPSPMRPAYMSIRIRDQGGGVPPANMQRIFSYAFTTAGSDAAQFSDDDELGGGPYAAQHVGGSAAFGGDSPEGNMFGEITGKGLQTGLGSIAGLGYGLLVIASPSRDCTQATSARDPDSNSFLFIALALMYLSSYDALILREGTPS
ncbi:26S proteasome regulatory subunit 7 [Tulasnella sp. 403]|nr:26S proteasome regulatory subunit 7 [Tulasnella sp. 403]